MKNFILLMIMILMISQVRANEVKIIDARGMSMAERIKLMADARKQKRLQVKSSTQQATEFMKELSKGISGLKNAKNKISGSKYLDEINEEAGRETQGSSFTKLQSAMTAEGGKVTNYRKISESTLLNDNQKKEQYIIEYENGTTQTVELLFIKPDLSGGFRLMEVNVQ